MAPVYKFAVIQLQPKDVAVEENFAKAEFYLRQAAAQGADLAILPEYHLTSWCPDHPEFISACKASIPYLARYQALAHELNINIVPGTICEVHPATATTIQNDRALSHDANRDPQTLIEIRNMAYWISPHGALLGNYQKKNLWHTERPHLTAGTAQTPHTAFDTPFLRGDDGGDDDDHRRRRRPLRAGLLICWDLAFPEAFRALVADGAELVVIPSFWLVNGSDLDETRKRLNPDCEGLFLRSVLVARAFENTAVVAFCNTGGLSQVVVPVEGPAGGGWEGGVDEEVMKVMEVDFEGVRALEDAYKIRGDMLNGEGWHYGYTLWKGEE
ncbi:Putative hydrolase, carbon-nitrogen family [Madurella fahalii]|uniref:Hydrolase, carbon-nitrogen family n=1 Tax=Madurella fahalii TaxID=1157608 RepID=A0ABQ0GD22_9PEZI